MIQTSSQYSYLSRQGHYIVSPTWKTLLNLLGKDHTLILKHAKLPSNLFSQTEAYLNTDGYLRLWYAIEDVFKSEHFPLLAANYMTSDFFEPPFFAAYCSPNLRIALQRIILFKPLLCPMKLTIKETTTLCHVHISHQQGLTSMPDAMLLIDMVFLLQFARMALREHITPYAVSAPSTQLLTEDYGTFFGCSRHHSSNIVISFHQNDLNKPFISSNARMWEFFEPELRKRLSNFNATESMKDNVYQQLLEMLPSGQTTIQALAERIYISPRTIQRRLKDENTNYKKILLQVREKLAHHYITQSNIPFSQIALLLGYEETSSFFRAFHIWSGTTPEAQRTQAKMRNKKGQ
ncbi:AraC family transcriptional regulator [uncultured Shewanella sp.]|uniref:AraC family transcriptional regulator n=1 Tax=uncultured Shewanella sp. TaxID=173975 RepID=UPI0026318673|nr:AraC family transcriptional regulator [uncultured Shewanella sp.]